MEYTCNTGTYPVYDNGRHCILTSCTFAKGQQLHCAAVSVL